MPPPGGGKSLIERARDIILKPKEEWGVIDAEPATVGGIFTSYVLILAAIGPIAMLIGQQVFGWSALGISFKPPIAYSLSLAVVSYVLALVGVYVMALIIDALAPSFGGTKDQLKAVKVAAYSATAAWLAGIFQIVPALAFLGIVGLYSLYLLWLGLPRLMRVAQDKAVGYVVVVIIVQIVVYGIVIYLASRLVLAFMPMSTLVGGSTITL
jgi:hypothetical protein